MRLQLKVGDDLLLGDAALQITPHHRHRTRPRRRLHELCAARACSTRPTSPTTGLIQPASRVTYRLAVAAPPGREAAVRDFVRWAEDADQDACRCAACASSRSQSGRPEMRQTLDRAEKFLNLVALLAALLAAVAVGIASRDFAQRHLDDCAMLRVLGLSQRAHRLGLLRWSSPCVGLLASAAGVRARFRRALRLRLAARRAGECALPPPGVWPALFGIGVGMTLLLGFGLPPVLQLARVPPLRVIRRDVGALKAVVDRWCWRPAAPASSRCCWRCRPT